MLAKIPLRHLFTLHLKAVARRSESLEVTGRTFYTPGFRMMVMAEQNGVRIFEIECYVPPAFLGSSE
jgi:hypothetical protein